MTCIVGLLDDSGIYMGGDSAAVGGNSLNIRADKKVFINNEFIMGFTWSFRMGQLLRYSFIPPQFHIDNDIDSFMVTTFIDAVRECLKKGGFARKKDEEESGGTFIVGFKNQLFQVFSDYQVAKVLDKFVCCGCGEEIAQGSMYSTEGMSPEKRIRIALEAAEHFSVGVRGPFNIIKLENKR